MGLPSILTISLARLWFQLEHLVLGVPVLTVRQIAKIESTRVRLSPGLLLARSRWVALVDPRPGPRLCQYLHVVPAVALKDAACH